MMSNQLPMLQLGRKLPDVSNQKAAYCQPDGDKYKQRMLLKRRSLPSAIPTIC